MIKTYITKEILLIKKEKSTQFDETIRLIKWAEKSVNITLLKVFIETATEEMMIQFENEQIKQLQQSFPMRLYY